MRLLLSVRMVYTKNQTKKHTEKHTKNHTKNHTKDHTKNHTKNHTKKKAPLFSTDLYISFEILQRFISRATQNTLAEEATSGCYIENFLKYTVSMRCGATFLKNTLSPCRTEIHQNKKPLNCRNRKQTEAKTKPNTKIFQKTQRTTNTVENNRTTP